MSLLPEDPAPLPPTLEDLPPVAAATTDDAAPDEESQPLPPDTHLSLHLRCVSMALDRYHLRFSPRDPDVDVAAVEERIREISDELDGLRTFLAGIVDAELPLVRLRERFGLDHPAMQLLVAAAAPALDLPLARRMSALLGRPQPDVAFLIDLATRNLAEERLYLGALAPTAPLVRWRLAKLGNSRAWSPETPLIHRPLVVPDRVVEWLRGETRFEPQRFGRVATLRHADPSIVDGAQRERVERALWRSPDGEGRLPPLVLSGPALSGKATLAIAAAAAQGAPTLDVDLEAVAGAAKPDELLEDLVREALLQGALLLLRHADTLVEKKADLKRQVLDLLGEGALRIVVTTQSDWSEAVRRVPGVQLVHVELPSDSEQLALWQRALPPSVALAPEVNLRGIVARYRLTPGDILEAGIQAAMQAELRGGEPLITLDDVVHAVRGRLRHRLGDVAELMTTTLGWDDVVLQDNVFSQVFEVLASIQHQSKVMNDWGFARKVTYGRAVSALFSGPPGTGKTMVATLIAKQLGLELFRVDLSRVVSKWVGETEKNLGRAFDEAKNSQAVLLFDEADALFAKRTDVKSSNDRYANLEVNYLLQRLEAFEGIVLLTTNNQSSIDDAFRRRLRFRIEFPAPDEPERELLWQSMIPPSAPVAKDVNFKQLARKYEMSGGYIKNAVVRAAFLAVAEDEQSITHDLLMRAAQLEWEEMGRLAKS